MNEPGITDDDLERMGDFLERSYLDRTATDLLPDHDGTAEDAE